MKEQVHGAEEVFKEIINGKFLKAMDDNVQIKGVQQTTKGKKQQQNKESNI